MTIIFICRIYQDDRSAIYEILWNQTYVFSDHDSFAQVCARFYTKLKNGATESEWTMFPTYTVVAAV